MNPFAELHERLAYSAVAGTALLEEDFRLKKMVDPFASLAPKNPVFANIHKELTDLFAAQPAQRGQILLRLLGVVDAVLYTQAGHGTMGELEPLAQNEMPDEMHDIKYSEFSPFLTWISGKGRDSVLLDTLSERPDCFTDPRVLHLLIAELGNPHIGTVLVQLLQALGRGEPFFQSPVVCSSAPPERFALPQVNHLNRAQLVCQLKYGFDAAGKKDMARRVLLVSAIARETQNHWYLSLVRAGSKEVKEQAVFALRYLKENMPVLLELVKNERGQVREMAYCALGRMDAPELDEMWKKNLPKSKKFAEYVTYVQSDGVADIVAKRIRQAAETVIAQDSIFPDTEEVAHWCNALVNKCSDEVFALYRWLFGPETDIHHLRKTVFYSLERERERIEDKICQTLVLTYPQRLVDFLTAFPETHAGKMERACFVCDLLSQPADRVYEKWSQITAKALARCFAYVIYQDGEYLLDIPVPEEGGLRALREPLDVRWFAHMVQNDCLDLLERLLPLADASRCQQVGRLCHEAYCNQEAAHSLQAAFGQVANCVQETRRYFQIFQKCQLPNPRGLILMLCKRQPQISTGYLQPVFEAYRDYAGVQATCEEARRVLEFYEQTHYKSASMIQKMRDMMHMYGFLTEERKLRGEIK